MKKKKTSINKKYLPTGMDRLINELIKDEPRLKVAQKSPLHVWDEKEAIVNNALTAFRTLPK